MLTVVRSGRFRRDVKRAKKRGKDLSKLKAVLSMLIAGGALPPEWSDHPLKGELRGWRDLHIEPDWLLIYRIEDMELQLGRTGTHGDLFHE